MVYMFWSIWNMLLSSSSIIPVLCCSCSASICCDCIFAMILFFKFLRASKNVTLVLFKCGLNNTLISFFSSTFWNSSKNMASLFISGSSQILCSDAIPHNPLFSGMKLVSFKILPSDAFQWNDLLHERL